MTVSQGDLLLGFAKINSAGTGYTGNTYVYNLGAASGYRSGVTPVALPNLNADLAATLGSGWANDTAIRWGVVGVVGSASSVIGGDPARTTYFSRDYLGAPEGSDPLSLSANQRGTLSTNLEAYINAMNGIDENGAASGGGDLPEQWHQQL